MKFQLLIFDWDGTLADSAGQIVSTMQAAIADLGLPPRADGQIAELIGLGFSDCLHHLYPELDTSMVLKLLIDYRKRAPATTYAAPLFSGVKETLAALHSAGYRLAVATGKPRLGLERSLSFHPELTPLLEFMRCADETANKPDPLMLQEILAASGVTAERALMIGDTEYDAAMAAAIGMPALGVACGVHDGGRLLRAGVMAVVADVRAVPGFLQTWARSDPEPGSAIGVGIRSSLF